MFIKFLFLFFISSQILFSLEEIQNCDVEFYDIYGDSAKELLKEMKTKNNIEGGYFGYTRYSYKSKCKELTTTCKVRIPRWADMDESNNKSLQKDWTRFYNALIKHEQGHVDIFWKYMNEAEKTTDGKSCSIATSTYNLAFQNISKEQKEFDKESQHGVKYGAYFGASSFQAIAFSTETGKYGFGKDYATKEEAEETAMEYCEAEDCKVVMWSKNACLSLAVGNGNGFGANWAKTEEEAKSKAISECKKRSKNCKTLQTVCPTE